MYDYYLIPKSAFYGTQKANEPIHISYDYGNDAVEVMNNTLDKKNHLSAEIKVLDFNLKPVLQIAISLQELNERQTREVFQLPGNLNLSKTWFPGLRLYDRQHHLVSDNFYTLSSKKDQLDEGESTWYYTSQTQYTDLKMLERLPEIKLQLHQSSEQKEDTALVQVKLKNATHYLAFMVHWDLMKKKSNSSVVPIFRDENYITLLPGEERMVSGYCHAKDLNGQ